MTLTSIPADAGDWLAYDPVSGKFTRKKVSPLKRGSKPGDPAGCVAGRPEDGNGYVLVGLKGKKFRAHRVAWFLMTGDQPPEFIDHVDGNRANNAWTNLRAATRQQNGANRGSRRTIAKGVHRLAASGRFQSAIRRNGRRHYLGTFDTEEEARAAYLAKAREVFGEFARAE